MMQRFATLFDSLDTTTSTAAKVEAMTAYFRSAPPADAAWATYVLIGRRPKRCVGPALLRQWLTEEAQLPDWLVDESYASVGDLAETLALLVEPAAGLAAELYAAGAALPRGGGVARSGGGAGGHGLSARSPGYHAGGRTG